MSIDNPKYENMPGEHMLTIKKNSLVCFFPFYLHPKTSKQLQILPIDKNGRTVCGIFIRFHITKIFS